MTVTKHCETRWKVTPGGLALTRAVATGQSYHKGTTVDTRRFGNAAQYTLTAGTNASPAPKPAYLSVAAVIIVQKL